MKKKTRVTLIVAAVLVLLVTLLAACGQNTLGSDYLIPSLSLDSFSKPSDLPNELSYLYDAQIVDDGSESNTDYMAHPDYVYLNKGDEAGRIIAVYPEGHGEGPVLYKTSDDGGITWSERRKDTPESWKNSRETPTIYRLDFTDGSQKLILISANCSWNGKYQANGFNSSVSSDNGNTWSEFSTYWGRGSEKLVDPIVAMASLTQLKENGQFVNKWMGFFHDYSFINYKTILTFDENGNAQWSKPEAYFSAYRDIEKSSAMCEVEVIRSDKGQGDTLALLTRSNTKTMNSLISFSNDEGQTWSAPKELPAALSGERLKGEYLSDGRLFITFRSIERSPEKLAVYRENGRTDWFSEGWVAWVGTFEDLQKGSEGQYRIKLSHTYLDYQEYGKTDVVANGDTGYCGLVVLPDDTIVVSSYGKFGLKNEKGNFKTYITSKRIRLNDIDTLYNKYIK